MLARQWSALVGAARRDLELFPAENRLEVRYEDLLDSPTGGIEKILSMAGLEVVPEFIAGASRSVSGPHQDGWRRDLDAKAIAQIEAGAGSLLKELGYHQTATNP